MQGCGELGHGDGLSGGDGGGAGGKKILGGGGSGGKRDAAVPKVLFDHIRLPTLDRLQEASSTTTHAIFGMHCFSISSLQNKLTNDPDKLGFVIIWLRLSRVCLNL